VLALTSLTTVATLMHLDRFHLSAAGILARAAAWMWLTVYLIVPLAPTTLLVAQLRLPGTDPAREAPASRMVQKRRVPACRLARRHGLGALCHASHGRLALEPDPADRTSPSALG
jgi:hypothetical protein